MNRRDVKADKKSRNPFAAASPALHACASVFPVPTRERNENSRNPSQQPLHAISAGSPLLQYGCFLAITGTDT